MERFAKQLSGLAAIAVVFCFGANNAFAQGAIYYTTGLNNGSQLLRLNSSGTSTALADKLSVYGGLAMDPSGNLIVTSPTGPTTNSIAPFNILRVNPNTGVTTTVSTGLGFTWGIAAAPSGIPGLNAGDIYVFGTSEGQTSNAGTLQGSGIIRIAANTGAQTVVTSGGAFSTSTPGEGSPLVFDSIGNLWAMTARGAIVQVDPIRGFQTQIATVNGSGGLAANSNLYAIDGANLVRIDTSSGAETTVAAIPVSLSTNTNNVSVSGGGLSPIRGIAVDSNGNVLVGTSQGLYLVNTATGKVTLFQAGGSTLPGVIGIAVSGAVTGSGLSIPTLTSISPDSATTGQTSSTQTPTVTLTGTGFLSTAQVSVSGGSGAGAVSVTNINVLSSTSLTATFHIPRTALGTYNVNVSTAAGTSNNVTFQVNPVPTIVVAYGSGTFKSTVAFGGNFSVTPIDTTQFPNGGVVNVTYTVGPGPLMGLFSLFTQGTAIPTTGGTSIPGVAVSPGGSGQTSSFSYTFSQGQIFEFGAEGYPGAVPQGSTNTYTYTASVTGQPNSNLTASSFTMANQGAVSLASPGSSSSLSVGWGMVQPVAGSYAPSGLAIFGLRSNNILVTEAGVPASTTIQSGRIFAEMSGAVNTGIAIANPNPQAALVQFYFTNANGDSGNSATTIPPFGQIAGFLNQTPFSGPPSFTGSFTFSSSAPVSVVALEGLTNERNEFLITTLPVASLSSTTSTTALSFPHFADGGGWTTQVVLVNPGDTSLTGSMQFRNPSGSPVSVTIAGQSNSSFNYSIPPRSSQVLQTNGAGSSVSVGSVSLTPGAGSSAPSGLVIFAFRHNGVTVSVAGVPAVLPETAFSLYAEASGDFTDGAVGSIQTGVAITNTSSGPANVTLSLYNVDGSTTGLSGTVTIPANGQTATFLNQVQGLGGMPLPFKGVLHLSSAAPISVAGLRGRYNERSDFLITTIPSVNSLGSLSTSPVFFPHLADGGGYTTQFILFSGVFGQSSTATLQLFTQSGATLSLTLQ